MKEDGRTAVGNWPWSLAVIPTLGLTFLFIVLWAAIHYVRAGHDLEVRWNMELIRQQLNTYNVDDLERYHERYLFRDVIMIMVYFVTIMYAASISATACRRCDTPFGLFSVGVIVVNSLRLIFLILRAYFEYYRLRHLANEIRYFKSWRDEHRLREFAVPSLTSRFGFNLYSAFELAMFGFMAALVILATVWVETGACLNSCSKGYHLTKHLVVTMYCMESLYMLSVVALVYFRRSLGLERAEAMIAWMQADNEKKELIRRENLKRPIPSDA